MTDQYEIEEMVTQDESGVVFRARDRSSGEVVAVRRFFPTAAPGTGFVEEETEAYAGTVEALKTVTHPSLCGVLGGGVDEVDGIPYLVTEWSEGETLATMLERGPLAAEQAVAVAGQGLEVLTLLRETFGGEAEWLEVEASTVMVNEETGICRFTICPLQVLGVAKRDGGVRGLGALLELVMGWDGQVVPAGAAAGLGGWVASATAGRWSVEEAYHELVKIRSVWTGEAVPEAPAAPVMEQAADPVAPQQVIVGPQSVVVQQGPMIPSPTRVYSAPQRSGAGMVAAFIFFGVLLLGAGVWLGVAQPWASEPVADAGEDRPVVRIEKRAAPVEAEPKEVKKPEKREETPQERIDRIARETTERMGMRNDDDDDDRKGSGDDPDEEDRDPEPAEPEKPSVFGKEDGEKMRDFLGEDVVVEAVLFRVRDSKSGKTRYMEFSDEVGQNVLCARCWPDAGMSFESLKELEGKKLRFSGKAAVEAGTGRIVVHLSSRDQIEEL